MSVWYLLALLCSPWLLCRSPEVHKATWLDLCCPCLQPSGWIYAHHHLFIYLLYTWIINKKKITFEIRLLKTTSPFVFDCLQVARIIVIMSFAVVNLPTSLVNLSIRATSDLGTAWFFLTFSRAYVKIAFVFISHFRHLKKILVITFKVWCPSVVFKTHNTYMRNFKKKNFFNLRPDDMRRNVFAQSFFTNIIIFWEVVQWALNTGQQPEALSVVWKKILLFAAMENSIQRVEIERF